MIMELSLLSSVSVHILDNYFLSSYIYLEFYPEVKHFDWRYKIQCNIYSLGIVKIVL